MSDLELVWRSWRALSRPDRRRFIEMLRSHCAEERAAVLRRNGGAGYGAKAASLAELALGEADFQRFRP
ncbi:hypothetical protein ACVI1L_001655 [Bradyrhizobium sp. USDA 4516]